MNTHVKQAIIQHALSLPTEEACGFIYQTEEGVFSFPCRNITTEPRAEAFEIDSADYIRVRGIGIVCGIYHSHIEKESFSEADILIADEMCLPIYLYVVKTGKWDSYIPKSYHVEPIGRMWAWGEADCLSTVALHYRQTRNVYITDYDRDETFEKSSEAIIARHVAEEGFSYLDKSAPIVKDDVLLFRTPGSDHAQHLAVVVGPNQMLHHPRGQLSRIDTLDGAWLRRLVGVLRYTGK